MNSLNYHNTFESLNMCSDIAMGLGGPRGPDRHSTPLDIAGPNERYALPRLEPGRNLPLKYVQLGMTSK